MKIKIIVAFFILFLFYRCISLSSYKRKEDYFEYWKLDTLSCKKFRNQEQVHYIIDSLNWRNKSKEFVINILGNPDTLIFRTFEFGKLGVKNITTLIYYFDTPCIKAVSFVITAITNKMVQMGENLVILNFISVL